MPVSKLAFTELTPMFLCKFFQSISSDSGDDDEDVDEKINRTENFKALQGEVIEIEVKRNNYGLGLALAGHKDRNRMGTYICGIHPVLYLRHLYFKIKFF